jgi:hypothetical protein
MIVEVAASELVAGDMLTCERKIIMVNRFGETKVLHIGFRRAGKYGSMMKHETDIIKVERD